MCVSHPAETIVRFAIVVVVVVAVVTLIMLTGAGEISATSFPLLIGALVKERYLILEKEGSRRKLGEKSKQANTKLAARRLTTAGLHNKRVWHRSSRKLRQFARNCFCTPSPTLATNWAT